LIDLTDGELEVRSHLPNPNARFTLDNLAYVTYTSGSTGQSKGVAVEHRGVSALLYWAKEVFGADDRAGVLASTSISFDLSIFELLLPLCWGGRAILVRDIMDLPCESAEVTLLNTVPSAAAQLAKVDGLPHSIRTVNLAGEPLSAALAQELYSRPHVKRVFNLYGPAESTVYSTFALVPKEAVTQPPIGCPIANARILILDRHLEPIPEGVAGELCIAGEGLARGYLNRPDLTAERFIQHSFGQKPEARLYRTGDLARYRRDGQIEYVGRMDRQLKIRGFRIEPGEIERALEEHADVQRAVVASANTNLGPLELVAYLLVRNDRLPGLSEIRNWLNAKLPSAMIPSRFLIVERFPLSPNGKIDLETLLREGGTVLKSRIQQGYGEWNNLERSIGHIWGKLLACDDFSAEDNFFDVGGHSLLLLDVQHELRKVDQHVSVVELFQNPTIRSLARHLSKGDRGLSSPDESRERARKRRGAYTAKRLQGSAR
jgi:amino acid adenylation domain-containing protein